MYYFQFGLVIRDFFYKQISFFKVNHKKGGRTKDIRNKIGYKNTLYVNAKDINNDHII